MLSAQDSIIALNGLHRQDRLTKFRIGMCQSVKVGFVID